MISLGSEEAAFADILVSLTPELIAQIYREVLTPVNMAYYAVAAAAAYWLGIQRFRRHELAMCAVENRD